MRLAFWKKEDRLDLDKDLKGPLSGKDMAGTWGKSPFEGGYGGFNSSSNPNMDMYPSNSPELDSNYSQPGALNTLRQEVSSKNEVETLSKNIEIISSKMDALKAMMESLSQRIANIEKIAQAEQEKEEIPKSRYNRW